jgi:hypothetical protein
MIDLKKLSALTKNETIVNDYIHLMNYFRCVAQWLRHYATSKKVVGSRLDDVNEFFSIYLILPAELSPEVYSASNRNEFQKQKCNASGE